MGNFLPPLRFAFAIEATCVPSATNKKQFVAIVPLGGRHVQHFWRLLSDLEIPYATLLDLDVGREGSGYGRLKSAIENLIAIGAPKAELLKTNTGHLTDQDLAQMHTWTEISYLPAWASMLKSYGVYFSEPSTLT